MTEQFVLAQFKPVHSGRSGRPTHIVSYHPARYSGFRDDALCGVSGVSLSKRDGKPEDATCRKCRSEWRKQEEARNA